MKAPALLFLYTSLCLTSYINVHGYYTEKSNSTSQRFLRVKDEIANHAPKIQFFEDACKNHKFMGTPNGGGWYVCTDEAVFPKNIPCIVYSYGLGADWSLDKALEKVSCEVHGFDPTGQNWRDGMYGNNYAHIDYKKSYPSEKKFFHNWGIGAVSTIFPPGTIPQEWPGLGDPPFSSTNSEPWITKSIYQTLIDLGHYKPDSTKKQYLTILKIDVEGAEWSAMTAFLHQFEAQLKAGFVKQLLIEWHWDPTNKLRNHHHDLVLKNLRNVGFKPWKIDIHYGDSCCLDTSYIWSKE